MRLSSKLRKWVDSATGNEGLTYWCQGCRDWHSIRTKGSTAWGWNGDAERPTFTPSVLVRSGHHVPGFKPDDGCWCKYNEGQRSKGEPETEFACGVCHTFIIDGRVQFLGDCTHALAGQTVELADLPDGDVE